MRDFELARKYGWLLIGNFCLSVLLAHNAILQQQRTAMKIRMALVSTLYKKIVNLTSYSIKKSNVG